MRRQWRDDAELLDQLHACAGDKDEAESVLLRATIWQNAFRQAQLREQQAHGDYVTEAANRLRRLRGSPLGRCTSMAPLCARVAQGGTSARSLTQKSERASAPSGGRSCS